ncbi:putative peptidase [Actinacidiphila reveromycinica]|uniref:Putative peptidase n=1 Tax=Actinacidiphila reveromycinica TaxID=659352 RepID=A0A7U3UNK3_9ACTN|nr:gamma-glutamyl-gamma-aminobutyrate hydrolase family protein [Streptomyces sp. SN-593]BBA95806.1 putative peptidase [Streptomyces sp. SN-593]
MTRRPLVGVSGYLDEAAWGVWRQPAALLPHTYVESVARSGGVPVVLPPQDGGTAEVLDRLDALVLAGGPDVDPARYGAAPHPRTGAPHPLRDAWEFALLGGALERGLPVLGVCRGMQVLNVALGGTLVQHLPDRIGDLTHQPARATFGRRTVRTRPGSVLHGVLGGSAEVSCYHHQAVDTLGTGLVPSAWSADGTVEAVEPAVSGGGFTVGVQWHPEADPDEPRLFAAFTAFAAAAATRAATAATRGGAR